MDKINEFYKKKLFTSKNTKRNYRRGIELFFEIINKDIDEYFKNNPKYESDIIKYWESLEKNNTQMTRKNRINAIKQFLQFMDKKTRDLEIWETISYRLRNIQSETDDMALDRHDIKKILQYGDVCTRSMFLTMASCGCRIGEIVQLELDDIYFDEKPTRIHFRAEITKTKRKRDSYISNEATESIKAWYKVRDKYLESAIGKTTFSYGKKRKDNRIFPMTDVNARTKWHTVINRAGYNQRDKTTNRYRCHPHCLRKFFRSYLNNVDLAEHLMGHQGYLSSYRQYDKKQLGKEYLKYMQNVTILETSPDLTDVHKELKEKDQQINEMQQEMQEIRMELLEVKLKQVQELQRKK